MGKVSPMSIKYLIRAKFTANGVLEKPDVIGAVFGQTEGLLGEDLELRELQKNGKIGRIEVEVETIEGKTTGKIEIPTSIDKTGTTIIAAALETIERIGPTDAKVEIEKIEDVRTSKREFVVERAKKLLEALHSEGPETKEMASAVFTGAREAGLIEYGIDKLPAGPAVSSDSEIIVVEGRADVISMLKAGIKNVIGISGPEVPETLKKLGKEKEITLFVDGDRGGLLVAKKFVDAVKTAYIAQAPSGKEVEELVGKEIMQSLRGKVSASEFFKSSEYQRKEERSSDERDYVMKTGKRGRKLKFRPEHSRRNVFRPRAEPVKREQVKPTDEEKQKLHEFYEQIKDSRDALLLNDRMEVMKKTAITNLLDTLYNAERLNRQVYAIVMDGIATTPIAKVSERIGCRFIAARNFSIDRETSVYLLSF